MSGLDPQTLAALSWTEVLGPSGDEFNIGTVNLERLVAAFTAYGLEVVPADVAKLGRAVAERMAQPRLAPWTLSDQYQRVWLAAVRHYEDRLCADADVERVS